MHRSLHELILVLFGIVDLVIGLLLFVYPPIVQTVAPELSINDFSERVAGAALLSTGIYNFYALNLIGTDSYVHFLRMKLVWAVLAYIGLFVSLAKHHELITLGLILFTIGFVLDTVAFGIMLANATRISRGT